MDVHEKVRAESERFYAALPALLNSPLKGRWVVFLNGEVQSDFDDEDRAFRDAVARFGCDGGFVIAPIAPRRVIWNTAPQLFKQLVVLRRDVHVESGRALLVQGPLIDVVLHPHPEVPPAPGYSTLARASMLVDTGAVCTMVDDRTARALGLHAIRLDRVGGATGRPESRPVYLTQMVVRLFDAAGLSQDIAWRQEIVGMEPRSLRGVDFGLLGRDYLAQTCFVYDGPRGAFSLLVDDRPPG